MKLMRVLVLAGAACAAAPLSAHAVDITGAGATFPYPIYAKWADAYKAETGTRMNYQSIGSGGGIKQIQAKTVTFGATDAPLKPADLEKHGLVQFPMVMGGIVPVVNIQGVKPGEIVLDGATLAKIFAGEIKTWNDPTIAKLNGSVKLPSQAIAVVHRSDGSGTTFVFTDYLSKVSADWKSKVGSATAVEWPVGIGAKGNEGVANNVAQTAGSIGYVEYRLCQAEQADLRRAHQQGRQDRTADRRVRSRPLPPMPIGRRLAGLLRDPHRPAGRTSSWPITAATFILMHKVPTDQGGVGRSASSSSPGRITKGDKMAEELDYIPMPDNVVGLVEKTWASDIKDAGGKPLYAATN